jgi:hypothetical protein
VPRKAARPYEPAEAKAAYAKKLKKRRADPLEKSVERRYVAHVRGRGAVTRKMNGFGYNSWPDQWTLPPNGRDFLIELKRKGKKPTGAQLELHGALRGLRQRVEVADSFEAAVAIYERQAARPRAGA